MKLAVSPSRLAGAAAMMAVAASLSLVSAPVASAAATSTAVAGGAVASSFADLPKPQPHMTSAAGASTLTIRVPRSVLTRRR